MSSLSGNAQRRYNNDIGKTEYTSVLFGFKRQHRLRGAALFFLRYRVLLGYLLYVYPYSLLYHKASRHARSSDFVKVNKFEATRVMTGFFNKMTHPGAL